MARWLSFKGNSKQELFISTVAPLSNILLVDDDVVQLQSIENMLKHMGYSVLSCTESTDALDKVRAEPEAFDLVIADQTMPKNSGVKLAKSVLGIRPDIPVILCTGFSELIDADKARELGINEFLMKPFSVKEMAETIRRVLKKPT